MKSWTAAFVAAWLIGGPALEAACAPAPAAFASAEVVLDEAPPRPSRRWGYAVIAGGVVMIGSSFLFAERGDNAYERYLTATDPQRIEALYQEALRSDRRSRATLIGGEALLATGLYVRFIRRPRPARLTFALLPQRCSVVWRF